MFDFLDDRAPDEGFTVQAPTPGGFNGGEPAGLDACMSGYQRRRQAVYDQARRLVDNRGNPWNPAYTFADHREKETAKAEAGLVRAQAGISRAQGEQLYWIRALLRFNGAARAGYASRVDLVAGMLDLHRETARDLVYLAERINSRTIEEIRDGRRSYTRVLEETRLREAGATREEIEGSRRFDLGRVRRMLSKLRRVTRADEKKIFDGQYVSFQPSLDGTHYRLAGRLGGYEGEICRQALEQRGDRITPAGNSDGADDVRSDRGLRRALALTSLCQDELDQTETPSDAGAGRSEDLSARVEELAAWERETVQHGGRAEQTRQPGARQADHADETDEAIRRDLIEDILQAARAAGGGRNRRRPLLMIVADQQLAERSGYEQGVSILAGPRVGPGTVDLVECLGRTEHITVAPDDLISGGTSQQIRPGLRRAVLARDDGCVVDACRSTYRLEVHHVIPRSQGGTNQADNLAALCWYHHHVAVHRNGLQLDPRSPPHRRQLTRPRPPKRQYPPPRPLTPLLGSR